jgi:hypothetical protein
LKIDLAVRDRARRDKRVGRRLKRVDDRHMDYLRKLFAPPCRDDDDLEVSCLLFYSLWIGNHFIAADHLVALAGMCSGSPSSIWVPNRQERETNRAIVPASTLRERCCEATTGLDRHDLAASGSRYWWPGR